MFTKILFLASLFLSTLPAAGCVDDNEPDSGTYPGTIKSQSAPLFDDIQSCDAETTCPNGLEYMYVAALELETPVCVDSSTICEAINCGEGECQLLELYPVQLVCQSGNPGGGGDGCTIDSDGNTSCPDDCTVSSDGTMSCPEEPGPGSEPGQAKEQNQVPQETRNPDLLGKIPSIPSRACSLPIE